MPKYETVHGGDIYRNDVDVDFSINTNPLGIPENVKQALSDAASAADRYPDPEQEELRYGVADLCSTNPENVLLGNGASEFFIAIVHAFRPKKVMILSPSFYGYAHAAEAVGAEIVEYPLKEQNGFMVDEHLLDAIEKESSNPDKNTNGIDMLFLASPNNPTGRTIPLELLGNIIKRCERKNIIVVLDECFIEFTDVRDDYMDYFYRNHFSNLIRVSAFTKTYAIPGVRLGYMIADEKIVDKVCLQLPEWNISIFAERAGLACLADTDYLKRTRSFLRSERQFLSAGLLNYDIGSLRGEADFLLVRARSDLYEKLLEKKILIRSCANFTGLDDTYFRIAVKDRAKNVRLFEALSEIYAE